MNFPKKNKNKSKEGASPETHGDDRLQTPQPTAAKGPDKKPLSSKTLRSWFRKLSSSTSDAKSPRHGAAHDDLQSSPALGTPSRPEEADDDDDDDGGAPVVSSDAPGSGPATPRPSSAEEGRRPSNASSVNWETAEGAITGNVPRPFDDETTSSKGETSKEILGSLSQSPPVQSGDSSSSTKGEGKHAPRSVPSPFELSSGTGNRQRPWGAAGATPRVTPVSLLYTPRQDGGRSRNPSAGSNASFGSCSVASSGVGGGDPLLSSSSSLASARRRISLAAGDRSSTYYGYQKASFSEHNTVFREDEEEDFRTDQRRRVRLDSDPRTSWTSPSLDDSSSPITSSPIPFSLSKGGVVSTPKGSVDGGADLKLDPVSKSGQNNARPFSIDGKMQRFKGEDDIKAHVVCKARVL